MPQPARTHAVVGDSTPLPHLLQWVRQVKLILPQLKE